MYVAPETAINVYSTLSLLLTRQHFRHLLLNCEFLLVLKMSVLSHPSLLARFGLCHSFDWPRVDFPPFLLVFLYHFLGDGNRPPPVLLFIVNQPRGNFSHILRIRKPTKHEDDVIPQKRTNNVIKSLAQSDLWKEPLIRSRARFWT